MAIGGNKVVEKRMKGEIIDRIAELQKIREV
jgi:ABC-type bacteriocin/lantibiotic exporter with double-glycine peptidase domain